MFLLLDLFQLKVVVMDIKSTSLKKLNLPILGDVSRLRGLGDYLFIISRKIFKAVLI